MSVIMVPHLLMIYISQLVLNIVYGGLPISYPGTLNKFTGGKNLPYNMIDVNPSCYFRGICPMFPPGGELSAFPNSEEKVQQTFHNLFRMFANHTLELKWGKWVFGANERAGRTYWCPNCEYCGNARAGKSPLYWYSDANQAARFKQYDENSCNQSWYEEPGITAHFTCDWVLPEYGGGSHCDFFASCSFSHRASAFCVEDRCWFESEGICGANTCYTDGHCETIFAKKYDYQGAGFVAGMNGVDTVYSRFTKEISYPLASGAHFDERTKIVVDDYHPDGKYFTLMLEFYSVNRTEKPVACYSLYDGAANEMEVAVSNNGDIVNGFSINSWSVMFVSNHFPPQQTCEPYSFICKTTRDKFFRLPEEGSYYFGTEWIDWWWSDYEGDYNLKCKENHYYYDGNQWLVNGGPELERCDIWYYKDTNYSQCIGCSKIAKLDCLSNCIYANELNNCDCDNVIGQDLGNQWCTPSPTRNPLPGGLTYDPTPAPTESPTLPTQSPTPFPSRSPTPKPTKQPLMAGQTHPPTPVPVQSYQPTVATQETSQTTEMTESGDDNDDDDQGSNAAGSAGGIAAGVIVGLLCLICCLAWIYFRINTDKPLYPTRSDMRLPGLRRSGSSPRASTKMAQQLSSADALGVRRAQSIRAEEDSDASSDRSSDGSSDEGEAYYVTRKVGSAGKKKGKSTRKAPVMRPPPPPIDAGSKHSGGLPQLSGSGLPPPYVGGIGITNMDAMAMDEATPLSPKEEDVMAYPAITTADVLSIEEAKNMTGADKEKYLSDEDFVTVFQIGKDEFYKLPKWKQNNAKKKRGFF